MPFAWSARVAEHGHGLVADDPLGAGEQADEYLLMGLRLTTGISPDRYRALAGRALRDERIAELTQIGFVASLPDGNLRVTERGWPVLDAVVADLAA